jgi:hypothetical protein
VELDASAAGEDFGAHLVLSAAQPGVVRGRPGQEIAALGVPLPPEEVSAR